MQMSLVAPKPLVFLAQIDLWTFKFVQTLIFACENQLFGVSNCSKPLYLLVQMSLIGGPRKTPLAGLSGDRRPQTPLGVSQHTDLGRAIFFLLKAGWAGLLMETSQMGSKPLVLLMQMNFWGLELIKTIIFACANGTDGPQTTVFG